MKLELDARDLSLLTTLVKWRIDELGPEIHHTDLPSVRNELESQRERFRRIHDRLQAAATCCPN